MVELQFNVLKQNIHAFEDRYSQIECEGIAMGKKDRAMGGIFSGIKKLVSSQDNVRLTNSEKRYEPFWHIAGHSVLEYKRMTEYFFETKPEVKDVKINGVVQEIKGDSKRCFIAGEDHCFEQFEKEMMVDANTGEVVDFQKYLQFPSRTIKQTEELMTEKVVVIPAKVKATFLVRQLLKELIKPIHADKVIQEKVKIDHLTLYFRPIYAFEFIDTKTGKNTILDVDALTGEVKKGQIVGRGLKEIFAEGDLFEIGTELATDFIPGAKAAVMVVKKVRDARKRKKERLEDNKRRAGSR